MKINILDFERVHSQGEENCSYIDFLIDNKSLSISLDNTSDITPYGWGINQDIELIQANRLINFKNSDFDNGLQSAYVCSTCGDEGCGAAMFSVLNYGSYVEWNNFIWSDGSSILNKNDISIFDIKFKFEIGQYSRAIGKLKSLIKER